MAALGATDIYENYFGAVAALRQLASRPSDDVT